MRAEADQRGQMDVPPLRQPPGSLKQRGHLLDAIFERARSGAILGIDIGNERCRRDAPFLARIVECTAQGGEIAPDGLPFDTLGFPERDEAFEDFVIVDGLDRDRPDDPARPPFLREKLLPIADRQGIGRRARQLSLDWWIIWLAAANACSDAASITSGSVIPADAPFLAIGPVPEPEVSKLAGAARLCIVNSEARRLPMRTAAHRFHRRGGPGHDPDRDADVRHSSLPGEAAR